MDQDDTILSGTSSSDDSSDDADIPAVLPSADSATADPPQPSQPYLATEFKIPGEGDEDENEDDDDDGMELDKPEELGDEPAASSSKYPTTPVTNGSALSRKKSKDLSKKAPINLDDWDKDLVTEINRVFVVAYATHAEKTNRREGHSVRELSELPVNCFSKECRRLLRVGTLQRRAVPKKNFCLKLGVGRTTNLLALIVYLTGAPAREPCATCLQTGRASYFGPECVVATLPETFQYVKGACACCYYSKGGCECDHARGYKGKDPVVKVKRSHQKQQPAQRTYKYGEGSPMPPPPPRVSKAPVQSAEPVYTLDQKMARYSEIYGGTDTESLLEEQRELIARMELLNRFLGVRFQQVREAMAK